MEHDWSLTPMRGLLPEWSCVRKMSAAQIFHGNSSMPKRCHYVYITFPQLRFLYHPMKTEGSLTCFQSTPPVLEFVLIKKHTNILHFLFFFFYRHLTLRFPTLNLKLIPLPRTKAMTQTSVQRQLPTQLLLAETANSTIEFIQILTWRKPKSKSIVRHCSHK